jgi:hypothetical protein
VADVMVCRLIIAKNREIKSRIERIDFTSEDFVNARNLLAN